MARRLPFGTLRVQLAAAIAAVTALTLALTFVAVYRATKADLSHRIDSELRGQIGEWRESVHARDLRSPAALEGAARRFVANQRYHPESRIFVIDVRGAATVTNHAGVVSAERARETRDHGPPTGPEAESAAQESREGRGDGLLDAPRGLATVKALQAGRLRVETYPVYRGRTLAAVVRVADPLSTSEQAESRLQHIFMIVGPIALTLALVVAALMALLIARPLRRITGVAADVDAGELGHRVAIAGRRGEIAALGRTFDRMLDRLQLAFGRQRQFVADASHELRTPLSVMRAQVELLRRDGDEQARQQGLTTLLRRLDEMDRLVSDMLTLANADGGRLLEPRWIDLELFLDDLRRDLPLFGDRRYEVNRASGSLHGDPDRLTQVLRNLVRNAVNHTADGDPITITVRPRGDRVEFAISDTGPGIAPDELEQIFERFHRADESRHRDSGGSGLGLPIARAIVEAHGGRIWAESRPGEGATIRFELPGFRSEPARRVEPPLVGAG